MVSMEADHIHSMQGPVITLALIAHVSRDGYYYSRFHIDRPQREKYTNRRSRNFLKSNVD